MGSFSAVILVSMLVDEFIPVFRVAAVFAGNRQRIPIRCIIAFIQNHRNAVSTAFGFRIVISVMDEHSLNAFKRITAVLCGSVIEVSASHPRNAYSPIIILIIHHRSNLFMDNL